MLVQCGGVSSDFRLLQSQRRPQSPCPSTMSSYRRRCRPILPACAAPRGHRCRERLITRSCAGVVDNRSRVLKAWRASATRPIWHKYGRARRCSKLRQYCCRPRRRRSRRRAQRIRRIGLISKPWLITKWAGAMVFPAAFHEPSGFWWGKLAVVRPA
jgi:hypothetical protein